MAIAEGQDMLIDNPQVLENDNDAIMVKMHNEQLIAIIFFLLQAWSFVAAGLGPVMDFFFHLVCKHTLSS